MLGSYGDSWCISTYLYPLLPIVELRVTGVEVSI